MENDRDRDDVVLKTIADILVAYLPHAPVPPADLPRLVSDLRVALERDEVANPIAVGREPAGDLVALGDRRAPPRAAASGLRPAVPVDESVHEDYLISLEDGRQYRSLRRHLMAKYGMTPDDYRKKWGLAPDYPMVAPSYARDRSEVAKRIGLGKQKAKPAPSGRSARAPRGG